MIAARSRGPACPKNMVYGPCGGVRAGGGCEVADVACPFAGLDAAIAWAGGEVPARPALPWARAATSAAPIVLSDLTVRPFDRADLAATVGAMAGSCDAVLVGDHQSRPDFPPTQMAGFVRDAGCEAIVTLSCRDRNRVALDQELAGLADLRVAGVLCVTGDGRGPGVRSDATTVFDLDGTRLAALAAGRGLPVVVPESPGAPPVEIRPGRLVEKQRAGASLCVLNHTGTVEEVRRFVDASRRAGSTLPVIGAVPVVTDAPSARVLQRFPGLGLRSDHVAAILSADDPVSAGIAAAIAEARELMAIEGVVGVNLSGLASGDSVRAGARVKAEIGSALRNGAA